MSAFRSRRSVGTPALARCAAICAPIVPAPRTAADRIGATTSSPPCTGEKQFDHLLRVGVERVTTGAEDPIGRHLVERAKQGFGGNGGVDVVAEHAGALAVDDGTS